MIITAVFFVISLMIYCFATWLINICKGLAGIKQERYHVIRGTRYENDETDSNFLKNLTRKILEMS